jgi:hypothetical protein
MSQTLARGRRGRWHGMREDGWVYIVGGGAGFPCLWPRVVLTRAVPVAEINRERVMSTPVRQIERFSGR